MTNDLAPEQPINTGVEKPLAKPIEIKPLEQPLGPKEEGIIDRIDQDGNPDNVLGDIVSGAPPKGNLETLRDRLANGQEIHVGSQAGPEPAVNQKPSLAAENNASNGPSLDELRDRIANGSELVHIIDPSGKEHDVWVPPRPDSRNNSTQTSGSQQPVISNPNVEPTPLPSQNETAHPVNSPSGREPQRPFQELPPQSHKPPENQPVRPSNETTETQKPTTFDVITQEQIDAYKNTLSERYGIDLSDVSINVVRSGDELFDKEEIKFKYFQHAKDPAFSELGSLLEQYEDNPQNVSINRLRDVARDRGITLEGKMPGFAAMSGDQMVFFAVQEKDTISMAQRYAEKEGDANKTFKTPQEATDYLKGLGEKAFLHEVGHIVYDRKGEVGVTGWNSFVEGNQPLIDKVVVIQQDKYEHSSDIPIAEEAFADYFVNVVGDGRVISRLGNNPEAQDLVSQMLSSK